jgi:hypothetical protein
VQRLELCRAEPEVRQFGIQYVQLARPRGLGDLLAHRRIIIRQPVPPVEFPDVRPG